MKNESAKNAESVSMNSSPAVPPTNLRLLFAVHAGLTCAAGIVLIVAPELSPGAVGIRLDPTAYLVCYLLAAAELSLAALSWSGRSITDAKALRVIVTAFIVLHAASGILEIYAFTEGLSAAIWGNIAVRGVVVLLFAYYGLYKIAGKPMRIEQIEGK
jgi:hypothetical protein